ncbi:MAG: nucleotide exchange factor GrpE [Dehalococcoidia bacterium]|nr:nucleotide exchange factor GrpE [Chloroflexi bacterium CFX7]MCK6564777.1 nucleotide exchange factor GrpE [Dehalococcoidia bacterium]MCL4230476.1 nucleotide exchange factor GrpE [Dehalococcoidia bacterium]NUQ55747.1 nucleotide exchange factor GrpE [Dehalococcoidia bacterium]
MTGNEDERIVDRRAASRMNDDAEPGADATPSPDELLAAEREKAESYYRNWQRSAADFANYKKRTEQEKSKSAEFVNAALVINLLPVYDDLERAVATVDAHLAGLNWVQGIIAIQRKFLQMLEALGVSEIAAGGEEFNPNLHEAVGKQPGDDGKVLHVVQKGYQIGDRVVRPAMVIVGEAGAS